LIVLVIFDREKSGVAERNF